MSDLTSDLLTAVVAATPEQKETALRALRGEVIQPPPRPATGPLLLGVTAGANLLGVSRATLWRVIRAGRVAKIELFPGSYRVRREDLEALAAGKCGVSVGPPRRGRPPIFGGKRGQGSGFRVQEEGGGAGTGGKEVGREETMKDER